MKFLAELDTEEYDRKRKRKRARAALDAASERLFAEINQLPQMAESDAYARLSTLLAWARAYDAVKKGGE